MLPSRTEGATTKQSEGYMNFIGVIVGIAIFLIIGLLHPIVIKAEYHFGKSCWPVFALMGLASLVVSLLLENIIASVLTGVFAFSLFWSIHELFAQEKRVRRGWYPANPKKEKK